MGLKISTKYTCDVCKVEIDVNVTKKRLGRGRSSLRLHGLWLVSGDFDIENSNTPEIKITRTVHEWDLEQSDFDQKVCCSKRCVATALSEMISKLKEEREEKEP